VLMGWWSMVAREVRAYKRRLHAKEQGLMRAIAKTAATRDSEVGLLE